jgi:hypothetical protein
MTTYRISFRYQVNPATWQDDAKMVFPNWYGEPAEYDPITNTIVITFDTPQTPVDLGPLIKVELLPSE